MKVYVVDKSHNQIEIEIAFTGSSRVGSLLLRETIKGMATDFIKVLNVSSTDRPLHAFLESHNIALSGKQLEMKLKI